MRTVPIGSQPSPAGASGRAAIRDRPGGFSSPGRLGRGQFQNAEANLKQQTQNLQRQTELYRIRVNALQDFQNARDRFEAARAQLASAKANLELARLNLGYTKVVACRSAFQCAFRWSGRKKQAFASHTLDPFTCEFRLRVCPISSKAAAMSVVRFSKGR
jgi:hypothetical protein